jgi:drug/metabolite transporter (DMT)-like permease
MADIRTGARLTMRKRTRKLIGAVAMLVFVCVYALMAMALAQGRITESSTFWQTLWYAFLGLFWIVPLLPLIKWMERPDPGEEPPQVIPR